MISKLVAIYNKLLENVSLDFTRYLYDEIDWDNRFIMIRGARGVGKTTLLLQHILRTFPDRTKALYVSVDNSWFATHSMVDLAEYATSHGIMNLFFDEVHKYAHWDKQLKEMYDSFPKLKVVITGSAMLQLGTCQADLGRRIRQYTMFGMSFREYLKLEELASWQCFTLDDILTGHSAIAAHLTNEMPVLGYFEKYLQEGYYPFYREGGDGFLQGLETNINNVINVDIPAVEKSISYESIYKIKILLRILAEQNPYTLNINDLSRTLGCSRDIVYKMLDLMHRAGLIRRLYQKSGGMKVLQKPEKVLFDNTNIMYALSPQVDMGTLRETFFANMTSVQHQICMPSKGDLLVDGRYLFEVGGKQKDYHQIAGEASSFVVRDGIEIGALNKIPLWLFGFLY